MKAFVMISLVSLSLTWVLLLFRQWLGGTQTSEPKRYLAYPIKFDKDQW